MKRMSTMIKLFLVFPRMSSMSRLGSTCKSGTRCRAWAQPVCVKTILECLAVKVRLPNPRSNTSVKIFEEVNGKEYEMLREELVGR
jgi:hypothetical protein